MTKKTEAQNWRKFLGITDAKTGKSSARAGGLIGKTSGNASGAGITDRDGNPEGAERETAENGDGSLNGGKALQVGDEGDRLTDLYDCETGEKVTIDGLGSEGTEAYPNGFDGCKDKTEVPPEGTPIYRATLIKYVASISSGSWVWVSQSSDSKLTVKRNTIYYQYVSEGFNHIISATTSECKSQLSDLFSSISSSGFNQNYYRYYSYYQTQAGAVCLSHANGAGDGGAYFYANVATIYNPTLAQREEAAANENPSWPDVDKNHLVWNKEKGCFEPLCPELNTQVLDKYKGCEDERILCDADGNKVKVKVDGDVVKVTQEKYGQTAEIKNGKVTAVKKLTESQLEAEFK